MIKRLFVIMVIVMSYSTLSFAQEDGDQQFEGFNLKGYTQDGEESWDVKGDTADIQGSEVFLSNVNANAYGEQNVNVKAATGRIDQKSGNMVLDTDVVITAERGTQLLTEHLDWNKEADVISTEDDVLITDDTMTVTGRGMKAQPGLKNTEILEDVTVTLDTEPKNEIKKILTITSDGPMVVDQAQGIATFEDNVYAIQDNQTLKADRMEIYFDGELSKVNEIICLGNVSIVQGENKTFADRAVYNAITQKISLYGRPKLIMLTEGDGVITAIGN